MKIEVLMPKMGESITEGRILKWLKQPGDTVDRDETILEIATDKVDTEVPSPGSGIIVQHLAAEGETVEVGKAVAVLETESDKAEIIEGTAPVGAESTAETGSTAGTENLATPIRAASDSGTSASPRFYSPVVMRIAATEKIAMDELERIPGTGMNGRVTKNDILNWVENRASMQELGASTAGSVAVVPAFSEASLSATAAPSSAAGEGVEVIPMDNMRKLMAEHMVRSMRISPHVSLLSDVDVSNIVKFRNANAAAFKQREGFSLTFMPMIADAVIRALKDFPWLNSSVEGESILVKRMINLGFAVALNDGGLIVPVVKHADTLNLTGLARAFADMASRARNKKLQPEEIQDGTFTITNFGVFGNIFGTPIINQPQVAILGVGAVKKKPVVVEVNGEDVIAIRSMLSLSLTFDHRIIDGAMGGRFLERVVKYMEGFVEKDHAK